MKKTMTLAGVAVLGTIAAPIASAAEAYPAWQPLGHSGTVQVESSSSLQYGGWCQNGKPASALAIRTTSGTKTLHIFYTTLENDEVMGTEQTVVATTAGQVIAVPYAGSNVLVFVDVSTTASEANSFTPGASVRTPEKCGALPKRMPPLPTSWAPGKPMPTKPAPTDATMPPKPGHPTTTAPAPTKPVPPHTTAQPVPVTSTAMPTHTTTMPSQPAKPGTGPKVDTDQVDSNNPLELGLGAGIGALALVGGGTVVARRRR